MKGGIARVCSRESKLYDLLDHRHNDIRNKNAYINVSNKINWILCTYNLLKMMIACWMTTSNKVKMKDHYGQFLELSRTAGLRNKSTDIPSSLNRNYNLTHQLLLGNIKKN